MAAWLTLVRQSWRFLACVCLLQGAHAAYYGFSAIYWQQAGYSASAVGYLWSLGVVAEVVIFALSKKVFRRFSARDLLLLSAVCGLIRWGLMGWTTALPGLILAQILHCGTFTVCHLAAMRYIAARQGSEVIRLPGRLLRGGDGRQYCHHDRLRRFPLSAPAPGRILGDGPADAPGDGYTAKSGGGLVLEHGADMLLLAFSEVVLRVDQRRRKQRQRRRIGGDDKRHPFGRTFLLKALYALVFDIQRQQR